MRSTPITIYGIYSKKINIKYSKDEYTTLDKTNDSCTMYNNDENCSITLPTITPNTNFKEDGYYLDNNLIGHSKDKYNVNKDIELNARSKDDEAPTITLDPNGSSTYVKSSDIKVTITDKASLLPENQVLSYAWSTSNTTEPTTWNTINLTNSKDNITSTGTINIKDLTGSYYLWIKEGLKDNYGNITKVYTSKVFNFDNTVPTLDISTSSTTNSITVVANAKAQSGIKSYQFSKDNGQTWTDPKINNIYTFDKLTHETPYSIAVKVISNVNLENKITSTLKSYDFECTNSVKNFLIPISGIYKLEIWGAQGGKISIDNKTSNGGYGGYATGEVSLSEGENLFLAVGCRGQNGTSKIKYTISNGGYNGGGFTKTDGVTTWSAGGGATSITTTNRGTLNNYENYKDEILIVAGGGGGAGLLWNNMDVPANSGGSGGGFEGQSGESTYIYNRIIRGMGLGGTQSKGGQCEVNTVYDYSAIDNENGSFGKGGNYDTPRYSSGGGGGFYGGGTGYDHGSGAGGGSGYIGNTDLTNKHMSCYDCQTSNEESTKTISNKCSSETPTKDCAKEYDGYAKITYLGNGTSTKYLDAPHITEKDSTTTIIYPKGCGDTLTCSYIKDNESEQTVTSSITSIDFGEDGTIIAKVTDGINTVSSTYNYIKKDLYVSSTGNDALGIGTISKPYQTLQKAYDSATSTTNSIIYVMDNIIQSNTLDMSSDKDITLTSYSTDNKLNKIIRDSSLTNYMIDQSTGTLTLKNIEINGNDVEAQNAMIYVQAPTYIEDGTKLEKAKNVNDFGGALSVNGTTLTMNGGTISNNNSPKSGGAGIFVFGNHQEDDNFEGNKEGTFIMNNGEISNNIGASSGAIWSAGKVTINNGNISKNQSSSNNGGAIANYNVMNIRGGIINNNMSIGWGGAIANGNHYNLHGILRIDGGTISNNNALEAGAIYNYSNSTLIINDGTISQNKVTSDTGQGGAITNQGSMKMTGGIISKNNAGTTNTGVYSNGGGIHNSGSSATAVISGGTISDNTSGRSGAGIFLDGNSTLNISGGKITNNVSEMDGAGIYIWKGNLNISGGTIDDNTSKSISTILFKNINVNSGTVNFKDLNTNFSFNSKNKYKIVSSLDNNYVLDVSAGGTTNGTNIQLYGSGDTNNQRWKFFPSKVINGIVYYFIQSQIDGTQYAGVAGDSSEPGTNVWTWGIVTTSGEQWQVQDASSGYYYFKNIGGLCLDLYGASVANGTNIQGYTCNQSGAQKWKPIAS